MQEEIYEVSKKLEKISLVKKENDMQTLKARHEAYKNLESSLQVLQYAYDKEEATLKQQQKSLKI